MAGGQRQRAFFSGQWSVGSQLHADWLTRSREAAKEDGKGRVRCSVFGIQASRGRESAGGSLCSSGFPARALPLASGVSGDCGTGAGALQAVGLTRSREAAKGKRMEGGDVCVELPAFSFQLSRIYSLWHGCHGPLTPDPSPPFHGGEGRIACFLSCGKRNSTPRPWKGRGDGGEG